MNELDKLIVRLSSVITGLEQRYMADQKKIAELEQAIKDYEVFCMTNLSDPVPEPKEAA